MKLQLFSSPVTSAFGFAPRAREPLRQRTYAVGAPREERDVRAALHQHLGNRLADATAGVAALPAEFRDVVILRELEEMSYRDIAAATGAPIGTVMSRLARARAQIRAYLDGERPALRRVK